MKKTAKFTVDIIVLVISSGIYSLGVHSFTAPAGIAPGGVMGISTITNHLWGIPIGIQVALVNIPLIIIGFIFLGRMLMIKTVISVAVFTLTTDYLFVNIPVYEGEKILAAVFGGVLIGMGLGLVYMREATTGGMDIINKLIQKAVPHIKIGKITFFTDIAVIFLAVLVYGRLEAGLFAVIAIYVTSRMIDGLIYGISESKMLLIISDSHKAVADMILKMKRGVTILKGIGAYTGTDKNVICCAVPKNEYFKLKRKVKEIDPNAFIIITTANEVVGEGFAEG